MKRAWAWGVAATMLISAMVRGQEMVLPPEVGAVWDLQKAWREQTPTRQRVCINGLWRWQPASDAADAVPKQGWGYFKVPGSWPGITDYMQKDCQTVWANPAWKNVQLGGLTSAWYQRQIEVPAEWKGRRVLLQLEYVNSFAAVFVDGKKAGEIRFPAGEVDLTAICEPGSRHTLSLLVVAMPLKGVLLSYTDSASARQVKGSVARRGLCGDAYLAAIPQATRIENVRVETSVRNWTIAFEARIEGLVPGRTYTLGARVLDGQGKQVEQFTSRPLHAGDAKEGKLGFSASWHPDKLWDLNAPENLYSLELSLRDEQGTPLDTSWPQRFGFREFWIQGRDFYLNGTRIFLSSVPLDNAQVGAAWASYEGAKQSLRRLKSIGINFVYTHNYDCLPGSHLSFDQILRAADDVGMLVSLTQPHFSHYDWKMPDADANNGYAAHARFYAQVAGAHPSVVAYAMSHNATGYSEDMNPDLIDGVSDPRDQWSANNAKIALRAAAIVSKMDPSRIVYHHASGNLGPMHTSNFYPNFAPIQELSDWFGHWASVGTKPVFTCEYAAPFTWDWTMYRGWYKGEREFGSAKVPWEFCVAEWDAQFLGDRAFQVSEMEKANLRWEARQLAAGATWHRWDYPYQVGSPRFEQRYQVIARYITDNWRAYRTWGVSGISPWEYEAYWTLKNGVDRGRKAVPVDWQALQRPGFSADYLDQRYERMDMAYEQADWQPTEAARALVRNNGPVLAYIAGKPASFTSKDHNFFPGETVQKQIIIINNSRQPISADCAWSLGFGQVQGARQVVIQTGQQERVAVEFAVPKATPPGRYELKAKISFGPRQAQEDSFAIDVLPSPPAAAVSAKVALFDPPGQTATLLNRLGIAFVPVNADADLSGYDILIVGKAALSPSGKAPDISRVRNGLKVILFEQPSDVLEKRLGFRVAEYGLRQVFPRVPDHPVLAGLGAQNLADWRGEATILPPRLSYEMRPRYGPTISWCGIPVTRVWRCGNRGNVASVLIEKPMRGRFLPIVDGGYSLQYSPLLEYRERSGLVLLCQMDLTGRSEEEPAAQILARNIVSYVAKWRPAPACRAIFAGDPAAKRYLQAAGIELSSLSQEELGANQVLIIARGGEKEGQAHRQQIARWLKAGGTVLAVGLGQSQANDFLPVAVKMTEAEHISAYFSPAQNPSAFAGIGPADTHNRNPRRFPLVTGGAQILGDGVLAQALEGHVIFCQVAPWEFEPLRPGLSRRTYRRVSFLFNQLLSNLGVQTRTAFLADFHTPATASEQRWLDGLYLDKPQEWDDPYRFFRW